MNIDSLRQTSAKLKYDIQTRYWPKLVVELESKSLRSLFFRALLLGLLVSVPWQCSRMVYNAYFTKTTEQQQEKGSPLASPEQNSGSITKMPDPRARRAAASPPPIALTEPKADEPVVVPSPATADPALDHDAVVIHREPPKYPSSALRKHQSGTVVLRVTVDANGNPDDIKVEQGSGTWSLDRAAKKAVSKWLFSPKVEDGVAVSSELLIPVDFKADQ
jgi:TonB family protein